MKVIIAGSRNIEGEAVIKEAVKASGFKIDEVVSGCARGVDTYGENWAIYNGIPVKRFVPDWTWYGKKAGILRNNQMAEYADALIAIWDGSSRGTKHMIEAAKKRGLKVYIFNTNPTPQSDEV